jgi:hypothetical protein
MDKERLKKTVRDNFTIIVIILAVAIILFLLPNIGIFSGRQQNDPTNIDVNSNGTEIDLNKTIINITDKDKDFKNWFYLSIVPIINDINCISKSAKEQNFSDTERCGRFLRDDSNRSLRQIDGYNISLSLEEARDEYRKSLEYYNLGGLNLEIGAKNQDLLQMYNATPYIQNGTIGINRVMDLLGNDTKLAFARN